MSGGQVVPDVEQPVHLCLPSCLPCGRTIKIERQPQSAVGAVGQDRPHQHPLIIKHFRCSQFGKRDAGEAVAEVHQFGVNAAVEVDVADAASEIADVELRVGDRGQPDRLPVSGREDLGCTDCRLLPSRG